jgi:hypothetical protein
VHAVQSHPRPVGTARMVPSPREMRPSWKSAWPWLFWACWGAWLAVSDLRNDDVQPAVLRMLVGGVVLGFARPHTWWRWGLALALWVPVEPMLNAAFSLGAQLESNPGAWFLPSIPALIGAFLGRSMALGARKRPPGGSPPPAGTSPS